jgi:hypothetical protein
MKYTLDSQLKPGALVGDTNRIVVFCTKLNERVPGDCFASWVAICYNRDEYHPYVVWTVVARPEGWHAEQGDYCSTLVRANSHYVLRGGESLDWMAS